MSPRLAKVGPAYALFHLERIARRHDSQKDNDARWTKRNDESFYDYKNHVGVDKAYKLIRKWDATDAAVHDSQKLDDVLDLSNTGKKVWADSARLRKDAPLRRGVQGSGTIITTPILFGLHHHYGRI